MDKNVEKKCPVEALSNILGKKWVPQIIESLNGGSMRFGEICRLLPNSSPKMIKQQLKLLEDNEIVKNEKEVFNNTISSTYYLSEKGKDLATIVLQMKLWGQRELDCTNLKN